MTTADVAPRPAAGPAPGVSDGGVRAPALLAGALGAVLTVMGFFLPWVQYQQATYSAFDLALAIAPALENVRAGGLKGFHIALHAVPALALVTLACIALAWWRGRRSSVAGGGPAPGAGRSATKTTVGSAGEGWRAQEEDAARFAGWGSAAAIAGLAITVLFLASGLLSGTPGAQFAPGLIRTDAAVKAGAAQALNAGDFLGLGPGVYIAIVGFATAAVGNALAIRHGRSALGATLPTSSLPISSAWRTQDYVFLAVLAIVFGTLYWWWLQPYAWVAPLLPGAGQVAQEIVFGMWFVSGLLGGYVIRRPGAALMANTLAALAEVLLGAPAGPILVLTGLMQALGPELVFAATGYRRWGWPVMLLAGVVAGLVALPWNWFRLGYFVLPPGLLVVLLAARIIGGALAGAVAKAAGDRLAATGALSYFPLGRERMREI